MQKPYTKPWFNLLKTVKNRNSLQKPDKFQELFPGILSKRSQKIFTA